MVKPCCSVLSRLKRGCRPPIPCGALKALADQVLKRLSGTFHDMYSKLGRPSIPPERLLKAQLLIALFSVRGDRLFCEMLDYHMLFRWFLDMNMDEPSFDHSSLSANRDRLLQHQVAQQFFDEVVRYARNADLLSDEHFTVDGTLIEAWAALKSFKPKEPTKASSAPPDDPGNPSVDFHGEKRSKATHQSTTDPEARLAREWKAKGKNGVSGRVQRGGAEEEVTQQPLPLPLRESQP
ncbi:MAG: transposase [Candidatus Binatia bacterium]